MKKVIIFIVFLLVIIGSLFLIARIAYQSAFKEEEVDLIPTPTVVLPTISDNIIVDLQAKAGRQSVVLRISGLTSDIKSIEYELTYMTGAGLARGVLGKINLTGEKEIIRDDIVLGTCSSGKCVYDTGVTEVKLSLKFNTTEGPRVFQKTYTL